MPGFMDLNAKERYALRNFFRDWAPPPIPKVTPGDL